MDAEINNVSYMELYSGAKMVDDKYLKRNNVKSIDQDSTVFKFLFPRGFVITRKYRGVAQKNKVSYFHHYCLCQHMHPTAYT
jgi:hypothetical protein